MPLQTTITLITNTKKQVDAFKHKEELLNVVRVLTEGSLNGKKFYTRKQKTPLKLVGLDGKSYKSSTENRSDTAEEFDNSEDDSFQENNDVTKIVKKRYKLDDINEWKEYYEALKRIGLCVSSSIFSSSSSSSSSSFSLSSSLSSHTI